MGTCPACKQKVSILTAKPEMSCPNCGVELTTNVGLLKVAAVILTIALAIGFGMNWNWQDYMIRAAFVFAFCLVAVKVLFSVKCKEEAPPATTR